MTREYKLEVIEKLSKKFKESSCFYFTDASGLNVAQINIFRKLCFEKGIEYKVFKNTLIKKALEKSNADFHAMESVLKGFTGIMFHQEPGNLAAKVLKEYRKKDAKKPALKAASINHEIFIGDENLETLSSLKSKQELIGDIIISLQSPVKNVISALNSGHKLAGLVKALIERKS